LGRRPGQLLRSDLSRSLAAGSALAAAAVGYALVEPARLKVRRLEIVSERWPRALDGLRVGAVSDLHAGAPHVHERKLDRVVDRLNAERPDLIALLGDYVDPAVKGGDPLAPERVARRLVGFRAPLGVFAVLGNHDWVHQGSRMPRALRAAGIEVLENDAVAVERDGAVLWVAGLADRRERQPFAAATLAMVPRAQPLVVLTHHPDLFPHVRDRAALTLAGHTHGGQLSVPLLRRQIAPTSRGYVRGLFEEAGGYLYVSRGVGTAMLPIRLNAPPEVVVLTLRSA
jgi:predicted MPP superfamily phosphohydrolase